MSPIRVDFYLLNDLAAHASIMLACRLLEKAYANQHQVDVYCTTLEEATALDDALWCYKKEAFIPHALQGELPPSPQAPPILIGYEPFNHSTSDMILNLASSIQQPSVYPDRLCRIIEIVQPSESAKAISRERYRSYRQQGFELHTHDLK